MQLELTDLEASELKSALGYRLQELRHEMVHTDERHLRHDLVVTIEHLETVAARLDNALKGSD